MSDFKQTLAGHIFGIDSEQTFLLRWFHYQSTDPGSDLKAFHYPLGSQEGTQFQNGHPEEFGMGLPG